MNYFYTDPLEAAYMCSAYGMVFYTPETRTHHGKTYASASAIMIAWEMDGVDRFYIHGEHRNKLSPLVGDICVNPDDMPAVVIADDKFKRGISDIEANAIPLRDAERYVGTAAYIVARGGRPFFWPDCEAA